MQIVKKFAHTHMTHAQGDSVYVNGVVCCQVRARSEDSNNAAVATVLLDACKAVGVCVEGAAAVRIKAGWGEPVCQLLHALLKHTITTRGVGVKVSQTYQCQCHDAGADDDIQDIDANDQDAVGWLEQKEELSDGEGAAGAHAGSGQMGGGEGGCVYAVSWGPERDTDVAELEVSDWRGDGWRSRLDTTLRACRHYLAAGREVCEGLGKVGARAKEEGDLIRMREQRLNEAICGRQQVLEGAAAGATGEQLKEAMSQLQAATRAHAAAEETVAAAQRQHDEVCERLTTARDELDKEGLRINDSSCLLEMRRAIKTVSKEIGSMDLRMGVDRHMWQMKMLEKEAQQTKSKSRRYRLKHGLASNSSSRSPSPE
jgi:hypothetical protein